MQSLVSIMNFTFPVVTGARAPAGGDKIISCDRGLKMMDL